MALPDRPDPGLPIKLQQCSNGEYPPPAPSNVVREAMRRARISCDENARRVGLDRREFLLSTMGAATTLLALAACSSESRGRPPGGTYAVPEDATVDPDAAREALGGDQPVVDVQTHLLEYPPEFEGPGIAADFPQAGCGEADPNDCFRTERWIEEVFLRSDTTVAVLSAVPTLGDPDPLSADTMARAQDELAPVCDEGRVLLQGHAVPNVGPPQAALDAMHAESERHPIVAWKVYTHVGSGFTLDDHAGPPVGEAFLAKVEELGTGIVCVHKGLGYMGDPRFASPADIGPAATRHPDLAFCVYHSGFELGVTEGPYDPAAPNGGIDRLVGTLRDAGIGPGDNVYAELGATWRLVMDEPHAAAHVLGKLLIAVGEDRVLWGTDSIWYGSPQDQIQAFRAFEISEELQDRYGYPALTDEIKNKILWRNAARLYDIDVARVPCQPDRAEADAIRRKSRLPNATYGPSTAAAARQLFASQHRWAF